MGRKRKKSIVSEKLTYEIEVVDWEGYYHFGIASKYLSDFISGIYWETSRLTLFGKILKPELKNASSAKIYLASEPDLSDHWTKEPTMTYAKGVGFMEIQRGKDVLEIRCGIPPRLSHNIHVSVASGKIKYVSIFGEKLKWRKGLIFDVACRGIGRIYKIG